MKTLTWWGWHWKCSGYSYGWTSVRTIQVVCHGKSINLSISHKKTSRNIKHHEKIEQLFEVCFFSFFFNRKTTNCRFLYDSSICIQSCRWWVYRHYSTKHFWNEPFPDWDIVFILNETSHFLRRKRSRSKTIFLCMYVWTYM